MQSTAAGGAKLLTNQPLPWKAPADAPNGMRSKRGGKYKEKKPPSTGNGRNALMRRPPRQRKRSSKEGEAPAHAALASGATRRGDKETAWREWDGGKEGASRHPSFILLPRQFVHGYHIQYQSPEGSKKRALLTF